MSTSLVILTIGWWLGVGAVVLEHNLAPFGHSKLNWNNPIRTTAHFAWHQLPTLEKGEVTIQSGQKRQFTVTLPRGFASGELKVFFKSSGQSVLGITAETRSGKLVYLQTSETPGILKFNWADLSADGHKFDFSLTASETPTRIQRIQVIARR